MWVLSVCGTEVVVFACISIYTRTWRSVEKPLFGILPFLHIPQAKQTLLDKQAMPTRAGIACKSTFGYFFKTLACRHLRTKALSH